MSKNKTTKLPVLPEQLRTMIDDGPQRGDLWTIRALGEYGYALIVGVAGEDPRMVTVVPMSYCLEAGDENSLAVQDTPAGMPLVALSEYQATVPLRVLGLPVGKFTEEDADAIIGNTESASGNVLRNNAEYDDDENTVLLAQFLAWHKLYKTLPPLEEDRVPEQSESRAELFDQLMDILGLGPSEAAAVIDGELQLDDKQIRTLKKNGVNLDAAPQRKLSLPPDLLVEIEKPMYTRAVGQYAEANPGKSDPRIALAEDAFMLAARKDGNGEESWRASIFKAAEE